MSRQRLASFGGYLRQHWRRISLIAVGIIAGLFVVVQLVLPWNNLPLYTIIDGQSVGGQNASDVTRKLDVAYKKLPVNLYFGKSPEAYRQPTTTAVGVTIASQKQVDSAAAPWWIKLVPTSLFWAHMVVQPGNPTYIYDTAKAAVYMQKELGQSCDIKAVNATLKYADKKLQVVPAIDGGTCNLDDVEKLLTTATPRLTSSDIRIPIVQHPTQIHDNVAADFAKKLTKQTTDGVDIRAGNSTVTASQSDVLSWLDFTAPDSGIVAMVNAERSKGFFDKQLQPKVSVAAGKSYVKTLDFTEIERTDGSGGQTLDSSATIASINDWLNDASKQPVAAVMSVAPTTIYTRTYTATDTGMTALITQFAQAHPGTIGVSFAELDGQHRHAGYQDTKTFRTASTYKLFVAYSTLKRIELGSFHWFDQIQGGRNLTKCFDDMIVKSDNACAEALLSKIGFRALTNEIHAIGLSRSSFLNEFIETTPADLTTFVGSLQQGQLLSPSSTNTLLSAMKRNVFRQGIPKGASGPVANKVGFLDGLLHDAAIVYSPSGTYVLTIMTDGSSWSTIAELTKQIEALRSQ